MKKILCSAVMALAVFIGVTQVDAAPIHDAARVGDVARIQQLLQDPGCDPNVRDKNNELTALMIAAAVDRQGVVTQLLQVPGIDVNAMSWGLGWTALMCAAYYNHQEVVAQLLEAGAFVNLKNFNHKTALDLAKNDQIKRLIQEHIDNKAFKQRGMKTKSAANRAS